MQVTRLDPDHWATFRDVRLRSLAESPAAFGSRYDDWVDAPPERWRQRLIDVPFTVVARDGSEVVGVVSGARAEPGWAELISLWVDPAARGTGVGSRLVDTVLTWAADQGRATYLMVRADNVRARRAYEREGFVDRGVPAGWPDDEPPEHRMERPFRRVVSSRQVWRGERWGVREDTVLAAPGMEATYAVVEAGDIVLVVPVDGDRVHLVEQYRHPVGRRSWELPSGDLEPERDADEVAAAARELREETGLVAAELSVIGRLAVTPSTMTQWCTLVLATSLEQGQHEREAGEQDMRSGWFTRAELADMVRRGELVDAKSIAALGILGAVENLRGRG